MLFIKFKILDSLKYSDFQNLYAHMDDIRQPGFKFKEEEPLNFDWDNMTEKEVEEALKKIDKFDDKDLQAANRFKLLVPSYANTFLGRYLKSDNDKLGGLGINDLLSILNYLEYDFEVDMNNLEKINKDLGIVEFSTGNFPFGGIDRFLMTLKAFDLTPIECFDGFSIVEYDWTNDFEYDVIELPEKTKMYLKK